jgi:tetratricopeptide (TPR) repeat protein
LYFGFGTVAQPTRVTPPSPVTPKRARTYDLSLVEEVALGVTFLVAFLSFRRLYDTIPLLMAMGLAACIAFLLWKATRLIRNRSVRLQNVTLKHDGKLHSGGVIFASLAILVAAVTLESALVQFHRVRGERWDRRVAVSAASVLSPERSALPPDVAHAAERAAAHYRRADRVGHGGWGLLQTPEVVTRRAWLALVLGDLDAVDVHLGRTLAHEGPIRSVRLDRARVHSLQGRNELALEEMRTLVAEDPSDMRAQSFYAEALESAGEWERAVSAWIVVVNVDPDDARARARLVALLERLGRHDDAARYR